MDNSMKEAINGMKKLLVFDTAVLVTLITVLIIAMIQVQKNSVNARVIEDTAGIEKTINETNISGNAESNESEDAGSIGYYDATTGVYTVKVKNSINATGFKTSNDFSENGSRVIELNSPESTKYTSIRFNLSGAWTRYQLEWYEIIDNGNNIKFKIKDDGSYAVHEFYTSMSNVMLEH